MTNRTRSRTVPPSQKIEAKSNASTRFAHCYLDYYILFSNWDASYRTFSTPINPNQIFENCPLTTSVSHFPTRQCYQFQKLWNKKKPLRHVLARHMQLFIFRWDIPSLINHTLKKWGLRLFLVERSPCPWPAWLWQDAPAGLRPRFFYCAVCLSRPLKRLPLDAQIPSALL